MMCKWLRRFIALAAAALALVALACSTPTEPPEIPAAAKPDTQATITALAQRPGFSVPTPTPVPQIVLESAQEFSRGLDSVNESWGQLRLSYDTWQAGLIACDPRSVRTSLNQFDNRFAAVVQSARNLDRASATRDLANRVVMAAETEQQALRSLRGASDSTGSATSPGSAPGSGKGLDGSAIGDKGNSTDTEGPEVYAGLESSNQSEQVSAVDQVDKARSYSAAALQEVSDTLADLEERRTDAGRARLKEFTMAFDDVNARWDEFHRQYDAFRADEANLNSAEIVAELGGLISDFSNVVAATRELPTYSDTQLVADLMAQTADSEDLVLRSLRATFQKEPQGKEPQGKEPQGIEPIAGPFGDLGGFGDFGSPEESVESADFGVPADPVPPKPTEVPPTNTPEFVALEPDLFGKFEEELVFANASRRDAKGALNQLNLSLSEDQLKAVAEFSEQLQALMVDWNDFHQDFDAWRTDEGGCDRLGAIDALLEIGAGYNDLSAEVSRLPNTVVLRPFGELLVEAARRESSALDDLKNSWRPFDAGIYQRLRQERTAADNQRRQVGVGIQDLLDKYAVAPN